MTKTLDELLKQLSDPEKQRLLSGSPGPLFDAGWNQCADMVANEIKAKMGKSNVLLVEFVLMDSSGKEWDVEKAINAMTAYGHHITGNSPDANLPGSNAYLLKALNQAVRFGATAWMGWTIKYPE
jgi:hypothetical protein